MQSPCRNVGDSRFCEEMKHWGLVSRFIYNQDPMSWGVFQEEWGESSDVCGWNSIEGLLAVWF